MPVAHINIGSNLGDSRALIGRAVAEIALLSTTPLRRSSFIESEPWGFDSPHPFLNLGVEIDTPDTLTSEALMLRLLSIQDAISPAPHRNPDGTYTDRLIDIDLIYHGSTLCTDRPLFGVCERVSAVHTLTLPHPRLHLRRFVLLPLLELSPRWVHPLLHLTPARMLARLESSGI